VIVSTLLAAGADASLAAADGRTALDFALVNRFLRQTPIIDQLRAAAAKR